MAEQSIPFQSIGAMLAGHASRHPDKIAIFDLESGNSMDFSNLRDAVERIAALLEKLGVGPGDRVALLCDERIEKILIFLAIWRVGAVACPFHVESGIEHLRAILGHINPTLALLHQDMEHVLPGSDTVIGFGDWNADDQSPGLFSMLAGVPDGAIAGASNKPDDIACIFSTSGTTDRPKCVVWDHLGLWLSGLSTMDMTGMTGDDRILEYRTFSWLSPQIIALMPFLAAGLTIYMARRFSHGRFFDWIRDHDITVAVGIPTVVNMLLSKPVPVTGDDLPSLRLMTSSSAPLAPDQWRAFEKLYKIKLLQFYGASEGGWLCGNRHDRRKVGTAGMPAKHMELAIIDSDGATCAPGMEGEITVRGPQTAVATITPDGIYEDRNGFRLTEPMRCGDLGIMDADGFVTVTGRVKDLIIRGGVNIAPLEIDGVVMRHHKIHEAAAIGIPDDIYGEEVVCYVVLRDNAVLEDGELDAYCKTMLPDVKTPKRFIIAADLPKSDRGKIRRDALKELWSRQQEQEGKS
jgi:acyl-coenzyme A synthetase/AMP-(fatty) acid ligase